MNLSLIILALLFSAFFSGSEIAFVVANRLRVEVLARRRSGYVGRLVQKTLHRPSMYLTTTLVGNNVALVIYSTVMAFYLKPSLTYLFLSMGIAENAVGVAVLSTQTIIASVIVLLLGEILPKSIMREVPNRAVFYLAVPLRVTYIAMYPLIKLAGASASALARLFQTDAATLSQFIRRDFEVIIEESREGVDSELDEGKNTLLSNVLALGSIRVKESMVPRTDVEAVEENAALDEVRERFARSGHSKLPVYRENIDHIVGVVIAYDLFTGPASLQDIIRPAKFVPESKKSKDLLSEFLASKTSIAIVIDEYGGTAGLVTREDLLEELIGDIQDEFDVENEVLRQTGENTFVVSGRVHIDELAERFDLELPEGDYETVAGYLLERLGTIPGAREEVVLDSYRFMILKATPKRVDLVRITRETAPIGFEP
ncbi:MAG TPA: hemolysin family protein [Rhodothermales bacterium]|nr:hemolysin family protein [Rhodothermales bacterium]